MEPRRQGEGYETTPEKNQEKIKKRVNCLKVAGAIVMAVYGYVCASDPMAHRLPDSINLVAHEGGHALFSYFGELAHVMGGTVTQLFIPAAVGVYFYKRRELFSVTVAIFWFGQNMFGISRYAGDALYRKLPLVSLGGGGDIIHDWNYMLFEFGLLRQTNTISEGIYWLGVIIIIFSVLLAFYISAEEDSAEANEGESLRMRMVREKFKSSARGNKISEGERLRDFIENHDPKGDGRGTDKYKH